MPLWFRIPGLIALCLGAVACQGGNSATPAPTAGPAAAPTTSDVAWQVSVSLQGGFAGADQRFSAAANADVLDFTDAVRGSATSVPLSAVQKREIATAVVALAPLGDVDRRSAQCRDCILFDMTLSASADRKPRRVRLDSTTLDDSPEARLIQQLVSLGREGTQRNPP